MLNKLENFKETLKVDGNPDRLVNGYEAIELLTGDPIIIAMFPVNRQTGAPIQQGPDGGHNDWGTFHLWPESAPSPAPHFTDENLTVKNIERWQEELTIPSYNFPAEAWVDIQTRAAAVDRSEKLVTGFFVTGLFERLHGILGFEGALVGMLKYPDAYMELCEAIGKNRMDNLKMLVDNLNPDALFIHDDWGTKTNLFVNPKHWRKFIKPHYAEMYAYLKEKGILTIHHADSFLEPVVPDMIEIGIDVWQGTLPQNDIKRLQKETAGKITFMGGIDAPEIDNKDSTEEEIRAEVRRACSEYGPGGHFIPSITYGGSNDIIFPHVQAVLDDEIRRYNQETYGISG